VEIAPLDEVPPEEAIRKLEQELMNFDQELEEKPRWLVFTKIDVLDQDEAKAIVDRVLGELDWKAPWFMISSVTRTGTDELVQSIGRQLGEMRELELEQEKQWEPAPDSDS
jgi:GTP-binding protein